MKNKFKKIIVGSTILILLLMIVQLLSGGFKDWNLSNWKDKLVPETLRPDSSLVLSEEEPNTQLRLMARAVNGEQVVTASVKPAHAYNKTLVWYLTWADNNSSSEDDDEWKVGKTVTDYVSVLPAEDTLSATLSLVEPFASQIKLTVYLEGKEDVKTSISVDYERRAIYTHLQANATLNLGQTTSPFVSPSVLTDSIGSIGETGRAIRFEYAPKLWWYGGSTTTPVEWTENFTVTAGSQTADLLAAVRANLSLRSTSSFDFRLLFTGIFSQPYTGNNYQDHFVYAMSEWDGAQASYQRERGASLYFGYKVFVNDVEVTDMNNSQTGYKMVKISATGYDINHLLSVELDNTNIIF